MLFRDHEAEVDRLQSENAALKARAEALGRPVTDEEWKYRRNCSIIADECEYGSAMDEDFRGVLDAIIATRLAAQRKQP